MLGVRLGPQIGDDLVPGEAALARGGEEGEEREGLTLLRSSAHGHAARCYRQPAERLEMEQTGRLTHLTGSSPGSDRVGLN